jgi:osmotically-inducible protein OsmY
MSQAKRLTLLLFAVFFASLVGCAGTTAGEVVTDTWITTKVKAALIEDPVVKAREISVETFQGQVQLSGFVSSREAMDQAIRVTRGIKGVTSVKNDMRLR